MTPRAYVGSYTATGADGSSVPGDIHVFDIASDGSLVHASSAGAGIEAGSLSFTPDGRYLYAVHERKNDGRGPVSPPAAVHAFAVDAQDGSLTHLNARPTLGAFPCYLAVDPEGRFVITASHGSFDHVQRIVESVDGAFSVENVYDDSSIALWPIEADGAVGQLADLYVMNGHGTDPGSTPQAGGHAQASSHAHSSLVDPSGQYVIACDKGADEIHVIRIDRDARRLEPAFVWYGPPRTGHRHPMFHPREPIMFVTDEIASGLSAFRFDFATGVLTHLTSVPSTSPSWQGYNEPADIVAHPNGKLVFLNNRGEDTVAAFSFDAQSNELQHVASAPLAQSPNPGFAARKLALDSEGRLLYVVDRPAHKVHVFEIDAESGAMTAHSEVNVSAPVFVMLAR